MVIPSKTIVSKSKLENVFSRDKVGKPPNDLVTLASPFRSVSTLYVQRGEYDVYTALALSEQRIMHAVHIRFLTARPGIDILVTHVVLLCQLSAKS